MNRSGIFKIIALILALLMVSTVLISFVFAVLNDL